MGRDEEDRQALVQVPTLLNSAILNPTERLFNPDFFVLGVAKKREPFTFSLFYFDDSPNVKFTFSFVQGRWCDWTRSWSS